eukprot:CAMPEP_0170143714 /NCGR_PEP_ID=MMETSP0033_2-20121228/12656_1 /TAXON_ID=195969 /ORGANISM="Dolichomastix tenuilepis, Strain CCMP3274" /LENGTH=315 /DNA_ID=CAMNT_0010380181 /DNA_START=54 /DNA_END=1001 /DNA_ORIENTATION=-
MADRDPVDSANYRGTYWNPPQQTSTKSLSPVGKERLRREQDKTEKHSFAKSSLATGGRHTSNFPRFRTDPLMRSLSDSSGVTRSLPTQIADKPTTVNINHLRGGKRSYNPRSNIDNWVEERFDVNYMPAKANQKKTYQSIATTTLAEATKAYRDVQTKSSTVSKPPEPGLDYRSIHRTRSNIINYGRRPNELESMGCYWVGTSPASMYKTISQTTYSSAPTTPEFQIRNMSTDARSRMLCSMVPGHMPDKETMDSYNKVWHGPEAKRFEQNWKSEYSGKFSSFVGVAPELNPGYAVADKLKTDLLQAGVQGKGRA